MKSKIFTLFCMVLVILPCTLFMIQNSQQPVFLALDLYYWGFQTSPTANASAVIATAFGVGALISAVLMMIWYRRQIRKMNQRIENLVR